jgi:hypothetical protein
VAWVRVLGGDVPQDGTSAPMALGGLDAHVMSCLALFCRAGIVHNDDLGVK